MHEQALSPATTAWWGRTRGIWLTSLNRALVGSAVTERLSGRMESWNDGQDSKIPVFRRVALLPANRPTSFLLAGFHPVVNRLPGDAQLLRRVGHGCFAAFSEPA